MVTMADVARHAGVTKQSVSNVVTGKSVRAHTRERVLAAIQELGYRPNLVARGLARGKTYILGLIIPTIANPYYAEIVEQVETIAQEHEYHLLLCTTHDDTTRGLHHLETLSSRSIDGLLLAEDRGATDIVPIAADMGVPVVLCNWENSAYPESLPVVSIDYRHAGELAGRHLVALGHRDIAIIAQMPAHKLRVEGCLTTLNQHGLTVAAEHLVGNVDSSYESGYRAAHALLTRPERPTAIFTTNDLMALGAMQAATHLGMRIPDDLSLVGLDNIAQGAYSAPPLTTIATPKQEMAHEATELLLRLISGAASHPHIVTILRPQILVRESTKAR